MSNLQIDHSPDLKRLRDEGYTVYIKGGILVVEDIPYVNNKCEIAIGTLISTLTLLGGRAKYDQDHKAYFIGDAPCHKDGKEISEIIHTKGTQNHGNDIISKMMFSSKPEGNYRDYHHKMTAYVAMISSPAQSLDSTATSKQHKVFQEVDNDSAFNYHDANSSRSSISHITDKLKPYKIGIIGLGGTGSYILDFVAKTPVQQIHIFDGDEFYSHNAFRTPGAPTIEELNSSMKKVTYLNGIYSKMHRGITAHPIFMDEEHLSLLDGLDFIFVAVDDGSIKKAIFAHLDEKGIEYIDVGMGVSVKDDKLSGMLRTTSFITPRSKHLQSTLNYSKSEDNVYGSNIQIAELNSINASLAVMAWKQSAGFYQVLVDVDQTLFTLSTMNLIRTENAA
ncbi:ThiF family adenylyltransferase [Sulfuricurvum sp.]|uniref:ThiF family adenylyltransferase n=1 Tax=Sulfuricurvum sp. TaxID=2025608 RepID=UPI00286DB112|nr:ThiF family adenylyltransferase [Sulfuricurvum sp.]